MCGLIEEAGCLKGCIIFNRYYTDAGQEYALKRLTECFRLQGFPLRRLTPCAVIGMEPKFPDVDFVVFWDKDAGLARFLEHGGIRVYNPSVAIEMCDDKRKTYERFRDTEFPLIPTVFAPLAFPSALPVDNGFLNLIEKTFGYPCVVKENVGSLGKNVYLVKDSQELAALHKRLFNVPHQYQKLIGAGGSDTRVYTVGRKAVAAVKRENKASFISNAAGGGKTTYFPLTDTLTRLSEFAANTLELDYGAIDFLEDDGKYLFLEANSSAYFKAAETLGIDIAGALTEYICKTQSAKTSP